VALVVLRHTAVQNGYPVGLSCAASRGR